LEWISTLVHETHNPSLNTNLKSKNNADKYCLGIAILLALNKSTNYNATTTNITGSSSLYDKIMIVNKTTQAPLNLDILKLKL